MPANVLIDRPTPEASGGLPSAGIGPCEVTPPSALLQEESRAGDSFALQLANFARSTANANVSEYSTSSQGKQSAFGPMGAGSSPVLGRCGPSVTMPHQGTSSAAPVTNRKSMNMTECVHVASSEHVAEIVGRQGSKIKALRAKTNTYIKTPVRGEEPVFVVTGRKEDVAAAKNEILSIAEHFSQIRAGRLNNAGNRTGSTLGLLNTDIPGHVTIHVRVPYRVVGLVVGPKGATIKRIQQDSQTYIVTPSRDREPIFEVTGLSENVEKARREIESYIALRTGTGLSETGLNSSNNTATMFRPFSRNNGLLEDLPGKDVSTQLLLGSVFKPSSCSTVTSSALASFNNTLNLSMVTKNHPLAEKGPEECGGMYQGLLTANKKLDGVLPNFASTAGLQNEFGVYSTSKALEKLVSPYCNNNLLANDFWSQLNNLETPLMLDGLSSFFPSAEEFASLQNEQLMGDCNTRTLDSLNFSSSLGLFGNNNSDIDKSGKDKNLCGQLLVSSPAYVAMVHSGSVGSASNSPSVSPTDSVGSPGQRQRRCIVCSDGAVVAALVPCGHNLFCMECAQAVLERTDLLDRRCPVCQQTASLAVRILS